MYQVSANINDIAVKNVPLTEEFQLNLEGIAEAIDEHTKLIFICSPNNPTGKIYPAETLQALAFRTASSYV